MATRGVRNNNPLNIRHSSDKFVGEKLVSDDKNFKQFESMEYGLRAAFRILRTYNRYGRVTVRSIIRRWAPETENKTQAYINAVCKATGLSETSVVLVDNKDRLFSLVTAMSHIESLYTPSVGELERAYDMAFVYK